jgi:hypothetical protein
MLTFFVSRRTSLFVGLGALLLILGPVGLGVYSIYHNYWVIPHRHIASVKAGALTPKEIQDLRNNIRQSFMQALGVLGGVIGGAALLGGLYFTARTLRIAQETLRTTQEGQMTERFGKAIEQLGDKERLTVRLGGIYALERIARDSPKDHWPIMEVLTTYIRDNAPWTPETAQLLQDSLAIEDKQAGKTDQSPTSPEPSPKLASDIQAALTVLGRRIRSSDREGERRLDLTQTDLRRANLGGADLEGASLMDTNLKGAFLGGANLRGAHLANANLQEAFLDHADLKEATLHGTDLKGALFSNADLMGARLYGADLREAKDLTIAQLAAVCIISGASLDPMLMEQIQREQPELFGRLWPTGPVDNIALTV